MIIINALNKVSQILLEKNTKHVYLCGGTGRKILGVGIDAINDGLNQNERATDIDIIAEIENVNIDSDVVSIITQEIVESLSAVLDIENSTVTARSKFQNMIARIAISLPIEQHHKIDLDIKVFTDPKGLIKNRPTTLMRRKIDISDPLDEESLKNLSKLGLDELIQSRHLLVDHNDQPIRNYVALCDDKRDYLITPEKRSYFLRRVCYDMATCGVSLPSQDIEWTTLEFFPSLYSTEPTARDAEYGLETLHRISRGLDPQPAIHLLEKNNYLGWLLDMSHSAQSDLFEDIIAACNDRKLSQNQTSLLNIVTSWTV